MFFFSFHLTTAPTNWNVISITIAITPWNQIQKHTKSPLSIAIAFSIYNVLSKNSNNEKKKKQSTQRHQNENKHRRNHLIVCRYIIVYSFQYLWLSLFNFLYFVMFVNKIYLHILWPISNSVEKVQKIYQNEYIIVTHTLSTSKYLLSACHSFRSSTVLKYVVISFQFQNGFFHRFQFGNWLLQSTDSVKCNLTELY